MADKMLKIAVRGTDGFPKPLIADDKGMLSTSQKNNNTLIASTLNFEVAGNTTTAIPNMSVPLTDYSQIYVAVRASGAHNFSVQVQFGVDTATTFGSTITGLRELLKVSNKTLETSGPIDVVGDKIAFLHLKNGYATALRYDVFLFGIKNAIQRPILKLEKSSTRYTESAGVSKIYNTSNQEIGLYIESGAVRVTSNGEPATATTGIPLGEGYYNYWPTNAVSVYFEQDSVLTVVSR